MTEGEPTPEELVIAYNWLREIEDENHEGRAACALVSIAYSLIAIADILRNQKP